MEHNEIGACLFLIIFILLGLSDWVRRQNKIVFVPLGFVKRILGHKNLQQKNIIKNYPKRKRLTKEEIRRIKKMSDKEKMSDTDIAETFNVSRQTINYWLNTKVQQNVIKRAKQWRKDHPNHKIDPNYNKNYQKNKYNNNPKFKKLSKENTKKWQDKNKKHINNYCRKHIFRCKTCERDFADKNPVTTKKYIVGICHRCGQATSKRRYTRTNNQL